MDEATGLLSLALKFNATYSTFMLSNEIIKYLNGI